MFNDNQMIVANSVAYFAFVLGYDLLQEYFANKDTTCDEAFDEAIKIYKDFIGSPYDNKMKPEYECLRDYVEQYIQNNKEHNK